MPGPADQTLWQRRRIELVALGLGLALVLGLWIKNRDDGGPSRAPVAEGTTTTSAPAPTTSTTEGVVEAPGQSVPPAVKEVLGRAVLQAGDLPKGFASTRVSGPAGSLCKGHDPVASAGVRSSARAAFAKGPQSVSGLVAELGSQGAATALLDGVRSAARACDGKEDDYAVAALTGVGDEALTVTITVPVRSTSLKTLVLVARRGTRVAVAAVTGPSADRELGLRALRAEVGRLA